MISLFVSLSCHNSAQFRRILCRCHQCNFLRKRIALATMMSFYTICSLVDEYDAVIILEDDLWVTPHFYDAAQKLFEHYQDHPKIGAISLYSFRYNEHAGRFFTPLQDKSDTFFMQTSSSWGQIWWKRVWQPFEDFVASPTFSDPHRAPLDIQEWFK